MDMQGLIDRIMPQFLHALDTQKAPDKATILRDACYGAYDRHPDSCSHAVNSIIRAVLGLSEKEWPHRDANALCDHLDDNWLEVDLARAYELAQQGVVVVGGTYNEGGHGHVIVVFPGTKKSRGGYSYAAKDGSIKEVRQVGLFPLALSTSMGSWPGAKSRGTKTVWDPWGKDEAFAEVTFWTPRQSSAKTANVSEKISILK
jgi:hypothetical protein